MKKNNISTKILPREKTESMTVVSSFFMAGIALSDRSGLKSLNVLSAEMLPPGLNQPYTDVQTTKKSSQFHASRSYDPSSIMKPIAMILNIASNKNI